MEDMEKKMKMDKIAMRQYVNKLSLWNTVNFTPIISHEQLQPIMATLGFTLVISDSNSNILWKEYSFSNYSPALYNSSSPRPRLPYPNIDGLHLFTYRTFINAVSFYLPPFSDVSDIFHVRGRPLESEDQNKSWRRYIFENNVKYVHCELAPFESSTTACNKKNDDQEIISSKEDSNHNSRCMRSKGSDQLTTFGLFVPLDDIITQPIKY